jgi:hypothetical protein
MANGVNDPVGGLSAATQPMTQPVSGLTAAQPVFGDYDDYTGRMGPDGEPERYSTMRGGDPRVRQQQELAEYERRLQDPITLSSWMTGANRDVRGLDPASQITLTPGTQYQIRDYTGKNEGQVIASGSTPEELLRLQDIARGLANQGRMADYRIEQVGGAPTGGFGQYTDPTTGEAVTLLGGDLYNRPGTAVVGDIAKIVAPIALQFVPGLGTALGAKLGLSGLGAKIAGVGLTSALGRTGAGLVTGEDLGEALKAGAIGGLTSGATAGLLSATGIDKALGSALSGGKGALAGEVGGQAAGQAAASLPGEIVVSASRLAPSVLGGLGGLGAAGGSLLGDVGKSLDPFKQALDQARLDNEFGLGDMVVSGSRIPQAGLDSILAGAVPSSLNVGTPTDTSLPGETLLESVGRRIPQTRVGDALATGTAGAVNLLPDETLLESVGRRIPQTRVSDGLAAGAAGAVDFNLPGKELLAEASRIRPGRVSDSLAAATGALVPSQTPPAVAGEEPLITVTNQPPPKVDFTGGLATIPASILLSQSPTTVTDTGTPPGEKKTDLSKKIATVTGGLAILDALSKLLGGKRGGTGGTGTGLDALAPIFRAQLPTPRGQFAPSALTQRDRSDIDYARYGYGPARSFFNYVPETAAERAAFATAAAPAPRVGVGSVFSTGAAPVGATTSVLSSSLDMLRAAMPGASDAEIEAFLNTPEGRQALTMIFEDMGAQPRAKGGKMGGDGRGRESFAVDGVGTGRSDEIPALLSDGEYVIDAETVAMLGDGSSRAGAKRLDDFRVKVRKHKGRNLAKGKFSANAKRPERYLSGGLV